MRLVGLDPGLQRTGWGVIEADGNALRFLAAGVVATDAGDDLALRLDALYRGLKQVVAGLHREVYHGEPGDALFDATLPPGCRPRLRPAKLAGAPEPVAA